MTKIRKTAYSLTVVSKKDSTLYWFQNGKLIESKNIDRDRGYSSHKDFTTQKKLVTFLRYLSENYKNTLSEVCIHRDGISITLDNDMDGRKQ